MCLATVFFFYYTTSNPGWNMRGRNQRTAESKTPRESLNTSLNTSTIQKYLREVSAKSPAAVDMKNSGTKDKKTTDETKRGSGGEAQRRDGASGRWRHE